MSQKNISLIFAFTAGAVIAGVGLPYVTSPASVNLNTDEIKSIVREVIKDEAELIVSSVQNLQNKDRNDRVAKAGEALKDPAVKEALFNDPDTPYIGPKDSKKVVVEFFDYNCPACKVQFNALSDIASNHKDVKVVFKEYPIFGPQSDFNAQLALAVNKIDRSKYMDFHEKMIRHKGRVDQRQALEYVEQIGLNSKEAKKVAESDEIKAVLARHRDVGTKLIVQGTPTVVVGDKVFPHAVSIQDIRSNLNL